MFRVTVGCSLLIALLTVTTAGGQDGDLGQGGKLYDKHCGTCHGLNVSSEATKRPHVPLLWHRVHVAVALPFGPTLTDVSEPVVSGVNAAATTRPFALQPTPHGERFAFAPPYGPNLRGVYGRRAGTVQGFPYSRAFLNALQGMVWNRTTLDVWLTNTQAWVPGVRMFYKQPDPEIRRKIIMYLQANP